MRLETGRRRKALINVTSLIDVVFLLLIFFVVTSTFLEQPGLDLTLPEASPEATASRDQVTVQITADGTIRVGDATVAAADLEATIRGALEASDEEQVLLEADERVSHGRVVEAMEAARRAGARGLVVATRPESETRAP